jgi:hypothetical protein
MDEQKVNSGNPYKIDWWGWFFTSLIALIFLGIGVLCLHDFGLFDR